MDTINRKPLKEFGRVFTYQKYLQEEKDNSDVKRKRKIVFNKKYSDSDDYCIVKRDVEENKMCFLSNDDNDFVYYLHLLLDSLIGRLLLGTNTKKNTIKGPVTIKALKDFPVAVTSEKVMRAAASLDLTIRTIIEIMSEKEDAQFLESARNLMQELRDDFVLELYAKPLFETNNIEIVDLLVKVRESNPEETLGSFAPIILKEVTSPDSALLSNIRRVRVLITDIHNTLSSNP